MKKLTLGLKIGGVALVLGMAPILALATSPGPATMPGSVTIPSAGIKSVSDALGLICTVFGWAFYFLIALAVVFIVIGAFGYLTSGGNAEKVKGASNKLLYAAIAVAVALLARAIPLIVADFLGSTGNLGACGAPTSAMNSTSFHLAILN